MDYSKFYSEVALWIQQSNQNAIKHGFDSDTFWDWVVKSSGEMCNRYDNNELVILQMTMLIEWLEKVFNSTKGEEAHG